MIQIKTTLLRNLDKICQEHFEQLDLEIKGNLPLLSKSQNAFISKNIKRILTSKPSELLQINSEYVRTVCSGKYKIKNAHRHLKKVFNYHRFTQTYATGYCGYELAKKLAVNTCPYCNRNYTVTVENGNKRIVRPDFDHFFPQKDYPLLALSFYNLIPSCIVCNRSVKNQKNVAHKKYIHPYEEGFSSAAKFNFTALDLDSAVGIRSNYLVSLENNPIESIKAQRCTNSFELFKLKQIYEASHGGEIADIIRKHVVSNGRYLEILKHAFPGLGTIDELYRIAFGNYYYDEQLEKRPLSKLTKDIVGQLVFSFPGLTQPI